MVHPEHPAEYGGMQDAPGQSTMVPFQLHILQPRPDSGPRGRAPGPGPAAAPEGPWRGPPVEAGVSSSLCNGRARNRGGLCLQPLPHSRLDIPNSRPSGCHSHRLQPAVLDLPQALGRQLLRAPISLPNPGPELHVHRPSLGDNIAQTGKPSACFFHDEVRQAACSQRSGLKGTSGLSRRNRSAVPAP